LFPLFATGVIDTGGKLPTSVIDTGGNLPLVLLTQWCTLTCKCLGKFEMILMLLSGAWGKMIHEKT
jgi:hypothetical protein